ncbi:MAG: helix-turn-helix domain-containing protein [Coxiellaceae bacterium]|nr:helix-turn-helix domain-containing protein [Coxiellaceae bacterium]
MANKVEVMAKQLSELGHAKRLSIFKLLVRSGPEGLPVGAIGKKLGIPGSTLTHHVSRLVNVGLVKQERDGTTLFCIPVHKTLDGLLDYLEGECCADLGKRGKHKHEGE